MGQAAQRWVRDNFDWSKIIPRYIELWLELKSERNNSATPAAKITWPARLDPMTAFQHYSSKKLNQVSKVVCSFKASQRPDTEVDRILKQRIFSYNNDFYASRGDLVELLGTIGHDNKTFEKILSRYAEAERPFKARQIFWLLKCDLIRVV